MLSTTDQPRRHRRTPACVYLKEKWGIERQPATLAKLACVGGGPRFELAGRFPLYPEPELDAWARSLLSPLKASTSETDSATQKHAYKTPKPQQPSESNRHGVEGGGAANLLEHGGTEPAID